MLKKAHIQSEEFTHDVFTGSGHFLNLISINIIIVLSNYLLAHIFQLIYIDKFLFLLRFLIIITHQRVVKQEGMAENMYVVVL